MIFVNAASCSTLLATYPFTPLNSSWIYTAMACAPAGAQGVRDALDILKAKGKLPPEQDRKVVVLTGDGAAQDIGLQSTMAAIHRGLDFYYLCYDNESYGNTGFQTSASTPYGARTSTEPITPSSPHGSLHERRDLFEIWRVQKPPYLATISATYPLDLSEKVYRASKLRVRNFSSHCRPARRVGRSIPSGPSISRGWRLRPASGRSKRPSTAK